jgi:urea carboxylase
VAVESHVAGNIWQVLVEPGQQVNAGDVVMILEAMKMELEVTASESGTVAAISQKAGAQVYAGQRLLIIDTSNETLKETSV